MTPNRQSEVQFQKSGWHHRGVCPLSAELLRGQDVSRASTREGGAQKKAEQSGGEVRAISKDSSSTWDPGIP